MVKVAWALAWIAAAAGSGRAQWVQTEAATFTAPSPAADHHFGWSVDLDGDTALVGESWDFESDGAAYVFERDQGGPGAWGPTAELAPGDSTPFDAFGYAVALHGDRAVVGAYKANPSGLTDAGAVFVFERDRGGPGAWGQTAELTAGDAAAFSYFGRDVALEGDTLAVGADAALTGGSAYVFEADFAGNWTEVALLAPATLASGDRFGYSLSLSGDTLAVGAGWDDVASLANAGSVHVFERDAGGPGVWGQVAQLTASDAQAFSYLGAEVAVSGPTLLAGAYLYDHAGLFNPGAVYVFERGPLEEDWSEVQQLLPSVPREQGFFGATISIEGDLAVVNHGHPTFLADGTALLFERGLGGPGLWGERATFGASDAFFGDGHGDALALSGDTVLIGAHGDSHGSLVGEVDGLTYVGGPKPLFASDVTYRRVLPVDVQTGGGAPGDPHGLDDIEGLAFDPAAGALYGSDTLADQLVRFDLLTRQATPIGALGFTEVEGLACDPFSGLLYGTDTATDQLLLIDKATGAGTAIGPLGFDRVRGLAFDPSSGALYGSDTPSDLLIAIDPATGAGTAVGPLQFGGVRGLAWDHAAGSLFGADGASDELIAIDPLTGHGSSVGPLAAVGPGAAGSVYVHPVSGPGQAYCTAGTSASGCRATLALQGLPSATASAGLLLSAAGVEGAKDGLFFFGTGGPQANPWGNGTSLQCVAPPVARAGLLNGAGTPGQCDGAFAQDLDALWCPVCPKPNLNPGAGAVVRAQLWYRDPLSTSNQTTSLSDAIEFALGP